MTVNTAGPNIGRLIDAALGDSYYLEFTAFLRAFDGMAQAAVLDKDLSSPPSVLVNGARYIVAASPTGDWAGKAGQIARYYTSQGSGSGWEFFAPKAGWQVAVLDEVDGNSQPLRYSYNGSAWGQAAGGGSGGGMSNPMTAQNDLIVGGSGGTPTRLAAPTTQGWVLTFTAAGVAWAAATGGGGGMTNPMTTKGDIIIADTGGAPVRLAMGTTGQVLTVVNATTGQLGWVTPSGGGGGGDFYKNGSVQMTGAFNEAAVPNTSASGGIVSSAVAASANTILIQTTDPVTGIAAQPSGTIRRLTVDRNTSFTHSASFLLFGAANIVARADDVLTFRSLGSGDWKMIDYARSDGKALAATASPDNTKLPLDGTGKMTGPVEEAANSAQTIDASGNVDVSKANTVNLTNNGDINNLVGGSVGSIRRLYIGGSTTTLKHGTGNLRLLRGADIACAANDWVTFEKQADNTWWVVGYQRYDGTALASDPTKVDKVTGKSLSTNDYTTAEQNKLTSLYNPNILVNGNFKVNQMVFTGGALAAGAYGHDCWGAYNGGANYSVSNDVVTLSSGTICQPVEAAFGNTFPGKTLTLSVESPSANLTVTLGNGSGSDSVTGVITAGSGRRGVTLTVPTGVSSTADLKVRLSALSGAVSFRRVKLEYGNTATQFDEQNELPRCQRFVQKSYSQGIAPGSGGSANYPGVIDYFAPAQTTTQINVYVKFGVTMRATPTITTYDLAGNPGVVYRGANNQSGSVFAVGDSGFNGVALSGNNTTEFAFHWLAVARLACTD